MANIILQAQTPLRGYDNRFGNTSLSELQGVSIYSIALALNADSAMASLSNTLGAQWPDTGHSTASEDSVYRLLGLQADQVFALVNAPNGEDGQSAKLPTLDASAYITDQSDSWVGLMLKGGNARLALERICPIDLHPSVFAVGDVTRTSMEHLAVIILCESEDSYLLLSPASSALSFLHAVETSLHNVAG